MEDVAPPSQPSPETGGEESVLTLQSLDTDEIQIPAYKQPRRISRAKGQNGFNPCCCFRRLCTGTCSLRTGCQLIGGVCIATGLLALILWGYLSVDIVDEFVDRTSQSTEIAGLFTVLSYVRSSSAGVAFVWVGIFIFQFFPGVLIIAGAVLLNQYVCLGYAVYAIVGIGWIIGVGKGVEGIALKTPDPSGQVAAAAESFVSAMWACLVIAILTQVYYILCALALLKQIRDGEYEKKFDRRVVPIGYMYAAVRTNIVRDLLAVNEDIGAGVSEVPPPDAKKISGYSQRDSGSTASSGK